MGNIVTCGYLCKIVSSARSQDRKTSAEAETGQKQPKEKDHGFLAIFKFALYFSGCFSNKKNSYVFDKILTSPPPKKYRSTCTPAGKTFSGRRDEHLFGTKVI